MNAITPDGATAGAKPVAKAGGPTLETVLEVRHWTDRLFQFRITRPASLRFRSGEFVMIGLEVNGKPLLRAYSIASPSWDEALDFYSIKVEDGPLTSRLQLIKPGDQVLLGRKPTGTLVLDALTPARRLYMLSTGTGIAPFASLIRDPETYERFEDVILVHGSRFASELAYGEDLVKQTLEDPLVGELAAGKLRHITSVTQEAGPRTGRITTLIENGRLFEDLGVPPFDPAHDRAMICGSMAMIADTKALLEKAGLTEGAVSEPGQFVIERAFVG
ncbi:MAG: ferredoxin--NADP reductase [Micropepsaceae bacterium]